MKAKLLKEIAAEAPIAYGPMHTITDLAFEVRGLAEELNRYLNLLHSRSVAIDIHGSRDNYDLDPITGAKVVDIDGGAPQIFIGLSQEEPIYDVKRKEF